MSQQRCVKNKFCRTCKYWQTEVRQNSTSGYCRLPHCGTGHSINNPRFDRAMSPGITSQEIRKVRWPERLSQVQYTNVDTAGDIMTGPGYGCVHQTELLVDGLLAKIDGRKNVLLFGGTFDPPTNAHIQIPKQVAKSIDASLVIYIPAGQSPHKTHAPAPDEDRIELLEAALREEVKNDPDFDATIWTYELWNPRSPSFTIDTLRFLQSQLKACSAINSSQVKLHFLMGGDQAVAFQAWKDYQEIEKIATPLVALRLPHTTESIVNVFPDDEKEKWKSRIIEVEEYGTSSSEVRRRVLAGESIDHLVPKVVANLISIFCLDDVWADKQYPGDKVD